jgi:eukaryotic-like serine/threonine-protein kinase
VGPERVRKGLPGAAAKSALPVSSVAIAPSTHELVLGRYRPVRPLGSGGSGSVWLACDERTGLDVALKIIAREGKAAARAEREAQAARRLRHERCVRAYDVGHDSSHVYIAYEYVAGRTVREKMRSEDLSDEAAVEIAAQVLDALAHAHRTGIVHRDVKPSNILLEQGGEIAVRLLDFGLAQFDGADTLTAAGDVPGTLAYIAPERLAGAEATPESDVWAVGVLLWEALAGRHPFWGVPLQEVARAIEAGAPPLGTERRDLPRRLLAAVDGALARDPERRPRASAFASELRAAIRKAPAREKARRPRTSETPVTGPRVLANRVAPVGLAAVTALLGATLLPFWPPVLVAAIVVGAGLLAWLSPRAGLAVALAAPIFPLGNLAEGAAVLYGGIALGVLALGWRDPRFALVFASGPLLAPLGLLALVPLVVQPARGAVRRAAQAVLAVLAATLVAASSGDELPLTGAPGQLDVAPQDSARELGATLLETATADPTLVLGAAALGLAAAILPWTRRRSRYGVLAVGAVLLAGVVATRTGIVAVLLVALVWGFAAAVAAGARRSGDH